MVTTRARFARGRIGQCRVRVARALLALIGAVVPDLARVLSGGAGVAAFRDTFRRRIEPRGAVLARSAFIEPIRGICGFSGLSLRAQRAASRLFARRVVPCSVLSSHALLARGLPVDAGPSCWAGLADAVVHVLSGITSKAIRRAGFRTRAVFAGRTFRVVGLFGVRIRGALLALIGANVPDLARVLSGGAGVAAFGDTFRRQIKTRGAVLTGSAFVCSDSTAKLAFWAERALCLVRVGVLACAASSAVGADGAHLTSIASEAYACADVTRHLFARRADCTHGLSRLAVRIFSRVAIAAV